MGGRKGIVFYGLVVLGFFCQWAAFAQTPSFRSRDPDQFDQLLLNDFELLPLAGVIDSAQLRSPALKNVALDLRSQQLALQDGKLAILKALSFNGNYAYGTNARFNSNDSGADNVSNSLSITESANYSVGIGIKLSLYDIINRKNVIKRSRLEITKHQNNREILLSALRELVVTYYHDCLLKKKLLDLYASDNVSASLNLQMARKQFQTGEITIAQVTDVVDTHSKSIVNFESAKADLQISLFKLSELAGIGLEDLIINVN